ncbi:MAG: hypothetical protein U0984_13150 [Prosthecobacter sp.]|nr:hypothetical protein [Prosthecobacter sp.]
MRILRFPLFRLPAIALAFAGLMITSPVEAKDKKDKDKHSDHDDHKDRGRDGMVTRGVATAIITASKCVPAITMATITRTFGTAAVATAIIAAPVTARRHRQGDRAGLPGQFRASIS